MSYSLSVADGVVLLTSDQGDPVMIQKCGIIAFKNETGEDMLLLVDYTDHDHNAVFTQNTWLTVKVNEKGFKGREPPVFELVVATCRWHVAFMIGSSLLQKNSQPDG